MVVAVTPRPGGRVTAAHERLHERMDVKRPAPLVWVDAPEDEGAWYDEKSAKGDIHFPRHRT